MGKSLFNSCAKYYDFIEPKEDIRKNSLFISKLLNRFGVKYILEIGCGTGSFLIQLKKLGFDVQGLDFSKGMLKEARKKSKIKLYHKDMSNFKINKKYDAIICIGSSLLALPNFKLIRKTIQNSYNHLNKNGIIFLDLPNHRREIRQCNNKKEHVSYKIPKGRLESIFLSYKKGNKWVEVWNGSVKEGGKVSKFVDIWEEVIYSPKELEASLKNTGFNIFRIYGSMKGEKFDENKSWRRIYLCQK